MCFTNYTTRSKFRACFSKSSCCCILARSAARHFKNKWAKPTPSPRHRDIGSLRSPMPPAGPAWAASCPPSGGGCEGSPGARKRAQARAMAWHAHGCTGAGYGHGRLQHHNRVNCARSSAYQARKHRRFDASSSEKPGVSPDCSGDFPLPMFRKQLQPQQL